MRTFSRCLLRGALLATCARASIDAQRTGSAVLSGLVLADSSLQPLANAEVTIAALQLSVRTNAAGEYRITDIPAGRHTVLARFLGYSPIEAAVELRSDEKIERDFVLVPKARELQAVEIAEKESHVSAKMRAFEEHRRSGLGHFLTREELEKEGSRRMSEILSKFPGIAVRRGGSGAGWIATSRGNGSLNSSRRGDRADRGKGARPDCYSDVYLDGALVYSGAPEEALFDVNSLGAAELEAVEYYSGAAQIPVEYNKTSGGCGVLLLWTRVG